MDRLNVIVTSLFEASMDAATLVMLACGTALILTALGLGAWLWVTRDDG